MPVGCAPVLNIPPVAGADAAENEKEGVDAAGRASESAAPVAGAPAVPNRPADAGVLANPPKEDVVAAAPNPELACGADAAAPNSPLLA